MIIDHRTKQTRKNTKKSLDHARGRAGVISSCSENTREGIVAVPSPAPFSTTNDEPTAHAPAPAPAPACSHHPLGCFPALTHQSAASVQANPVRLGDPLDEVDQARGESLLPEDLTTGSIDRRKASRVCGRVNVCACMPVANANATPWQTTDSKQKPQRYRRLKVGTNPSLGREIRKTSFSTLVRVSTGATRGKLVN